MTDLNKLPFFVNKRIIDYVFSNTWMSTKNKLTIIGVCQVWREIVMPRLCGTIYISRANYGTPLILKLSGLPGIFITRGCRNIAPFSTNDVFRHVRSLIIHFYSNDGLGELYSMLEHVFSLDSFKLAAIDELHVRISGDLDSDNHNISDYSKQVVEVLTRNIPSVATLDLESYPSFTLPDLFFTSMLAGYAGISHLNLGSIGFSDFSNLANFKSLTVLNLSLGDSNYHILSFGEPKIVRKLIIQEEGSAYLWKYFSPHKHNSIELEFTDLTELSVLLFYNIDDSGLVNPFLSEHRRLRDEWADAISSRRITFPRLEDLCFYDCYFVDLLFSNSKFPKDIAKVSTCHRYTGSFSSYIWILNNIPTRNISAKFTLDIFDDTSEWCNGMLDFHSNHKIKDLSINEYFPFDRVHIHLPMLQSLFIEEAYFSRLVSLLSKLPNLCKLTLKLYSKNDDAPEDNPDFLATSICPNLVKLTVEPSFYKHKENFYACMQCLLRNFTGLRVAVFNRVYDGLVSYVTENNDKYPHFQQLSVFLYEVPLECLIWQ